MKVIFFGTPEYVLPIVEAIHKTHKLVAVVTQPPKLVGRGQIKSFSPVDHWAHKRKGIDILRDLDVKNFPEAELGIVAAYGKIIPKNVISHFKYGVLNVHPSLLPKYRGASPIQAAIVNGETETGVTVIKMDDLMDHGPIVSYFVEQIGEDDTNESLRKKLFDRSAQFLMDLIPNYVNKKTKIKEQDHEKVTFTKIMTKEDGFVDLKKEKAIDIERKLRAYKPWPGVYTIVDGKRIKILGAHIEDEKLVLDKVQLEGKKTVSFEEFKRGYPDIELGFES